MTDKERKARDEKILLQLADAINSLPEEEKIRMLGWAEGVNSVTHPIRQKDDRAG